MCDARRRDLVRIIRQQWPTFELGHAGSGHWRIVLLHGDVRRVICTSATPSDWRTMRNFECQLRRAIRLLTGSPT